MGRKDCIAQQFLGAPQAANQAINQLQLYETTSPLQRLHPLSTLAVLLCDRTQATSVLPSFHQDTFTDKTFLMTTFVAIEVRKDEYVNTCTLF